MALAVPGLGVLLVLFWLLLPAPFIWLHRRAIDGGGPELARFLQLWVSSTKWIGLVYGLSWLMYGLLCFAGALKWPEEKSAFLICGAVMAVFIGRHLWQTRALLRTRPYFMGIKMIADTPGQPLWSRVRLLAADLGTNPPRSICISRHEPDSLFLESIEGTEGILDAPCLCLNLFHLDLFTEAELRAVIAHELAHLVHQDEIVDSYRRGVARAGWARVALETQVGRDGAEVWRLLADFPYALGPLIWPRMRSVELQCDRSAASVVSPREMVSALLKLSLSDDDFESARECKHQQGDSDQREQIEWPSTHPTLVERASALRVSISGLQNDPSRSDSGQAARSLVPELDSIRQELLDETESV